MRQGDTVNNVNMLTSKGMPTLPIKDAAFFTEEWNGFVIQELPWLGESNRVEGYDGYLAESLVGIDISKLPEGIANNIIGGYTSEYFKDRYNIDFDTNDSDTNIIWFPYSDLLPTKKEARFLSYIIFQTGVDKPFLINGEGKDGQYTMGAIHTTGNAVGICIPMEEPMDFDQYSNPLVRVEYDTEDMISLYLTDDGKYKPCLNLDDPFPFDIECEEYDEDDEAEIEDGFEIKDIKNAKPLAPLVIRRGPQLQALQFIKPNYADIHHIEIRHATVDDIKQAEVLYEGNENVFFHRTNVRTPHYYWALTVNSNGEKSDPAQFKLRPYSTLPEIEDSSEISDPKAKQPPFKVADPITVNGHRALVQTKFKESINPTKPDQWNPKDHLRKDIKNLMTKEPSYELDITNMYLGLNSMDVYNETAQPVPVKSPSDTVNMFKDTNVLCDFASESYFYVNIPSEGIYNNFTFTLDNNDDPSKCGTYVVVNLPKGITCEQVENAIPYPFDTPIKGLAAINYKDLVPFEDFIPEQFIFQAEFEGMTVSPSASGNGCVPKFGLTMPIPLSVENAALIIEMNPRKAICLYESNQGKYIPVVNLENPFPFAIELTMMEKPC